jgi:hypothetical protein
MTTLGKILVGLNLLFSLVVVAFIAMTFIPNTNWEAGFNNLKTEVTKERNSRIAEVEAKNRMEAQLNLTIKDQKDKLDDTGKERDLAKAQKEKAEKDLGVANAELAKAQNTAKQMQATIENREAEVKNLDERLKSLIASNTKLIDENKDLSKKKIEFEIAFDSAKERNKNLMDQYQDLLKQFEAYRLGDGAKMRAGLIRNPPPEDIKGSIKAVAAGEGLVTINLGSDSGLARDHTLEVYRLKPTPQYVGIVRILDVRPNEAVGKLTLRRGQVQVGDEVASEIVSKR